MNNQTVIISGIIIGVFQLVIAALTVWFVSKSTHAKVGLDESETEKNYRDLYIGLKADLKNVKEESEIAMSKTKELEAMMKKNRVLIALAIEMGGKVELESYEWFNEDMVKITS